ncbi:hypothetical protein LOTGIDRAFT_196500 [Lottia gigantea]|uniref:Steroid 21-hydroxylase n=1 Tax=Lottia gigantea TaxID=225164 RepID=V3ZUN8_LOTGI|nr:hypothetical protein LOTGIDRAFT_196500 [Lottia gigantea]ESO84646.1 hypothetical protein LOTGIDRAFT_196500 [Lottia gigantea]
MLETLTNNIPLTITSQALIVGLTIGMISYRFIGKKYKLPPGPWGPPFFGNLWSFRSESLFRLLCKWKVKYGPIITVHFGPVKCVTLNSTEVVREALIKKDIDFAGRLKTHTFERLTNGYKDIVFGDFGTEWKVLRKVALQGMRQFASGEKLGEKLHESGSKVFKLMREKEGEVLDIEKHITLFIVNFIYGLCFHKSFEIDDKEFLYILQLFTKISAEFGNGLWEDIIPLLRYYPTKKYIRIMDAFDYLNDLLIKEHENHKKSFSTDDMKDLTDYLINARNEAIAEDPAVEQMITDQHIVETLKDIFTAGVDTTRQTLTWTIYLLVQHPEIQKKAQEEIDQVLDAGQQPSISDKERLPYTEAVLHESMRFMPVVPLGVPHSTLCDTTLGEYDIPKGTMVMVNHYALHMDKDVWGDPEVFRPERLLDEDGSLAPKPMSWLPFSCGRRNCLGETIARPEMLLVLAMLLRNFSFSCAEGKIMNMTPLESTISLPPPQNDLIAEVRK